MGRGDNQPVAADLLIETVGFQALEDHRVHDRVRTLPCPLPSNDARRAQTGEQVVHQAEDLTWWTRREREGKKLSLHVLSVVFPVQQIEATCVHSTTP